MPLDLASVFVVCLRDLACAQGRIRKENRVATSRDDGATGQDKECNVSCVLYGRVIVQERQLRREPGHGQYARHEDLPR